VRVACGDTVTVNPGAQVDVKATVWNYGDADGDDTVTLASDGVALDTRRIHCAANTDTVVTFAVAALSPGAHVLSIDNCKAVIFVAGASAVAPHGMSPHAAFEVRQQYTVRVINVQGGLFASSSPIGSIRIPACSSVIAQRNIPC